MKDAAWNNFCKALNAAMRGDTPISTAALALALGGDVTEEMVSNWRRGRSHPKLTDLGRVVSALNALRHEDDQEFIALSTLLREMGVALEVRDAELVDKAVRLQKLELKIESAIALSAEMGRSGGAAAIVQAAIRTGQWAVGVWPAYEGPDDEHLMHVADRIDIMRVSPIQDVPLTDDDVWRDPDMKGALRAARAIRASASPRLSDSVVAPVSQWSILNLGSPRDALVADPWPGLPGSICFAATTIGSWVNDVAAVVALQLGYGLASVRDLVMEVQGLTYGVSTSKAQLDVHDQLVLQPLRRRVWSYVGGLGSDDAAIRNRIEVATRGKSVFVILDESDRLLKAEARRARGRDIDDLRRDRDSLRTLGEALPRGRVIELEAQYFLSRTERWRQVLRTALSVLEALEANGSVVRSPELMRATDAGVRRDPSLAGPLRDWFETNGWYQKRGIGSSPR